MLANRVFWTAACVALAAALAYRLSLDTSDPVGPAPKKIAFITGGPGPYWEAAIAGAQQAARERGIELAPQSPASAENVEQQMQLLSIAGSSQVDAIAISPIDAERQSELITQIAGLKPVVTFDSDASGSARHGHVGTSNFSAGLVAGTLVKKAIPAGGEVAVFLANQTKENLIDRLVGFKTRLAESPVPEASSTDPRFRLVGVFSDAGDDQLLRTNVERVLAEHPNLACLVTLNARQGPVAVAALESAGKSDQVRVVVFDTPEETLDALERGRIFAAIAQDPFAYGYESIGMLDSLCRGDEKFLPVVGRAAIHISVEPVTTENVVSFRKKLLARSGKTGGAPPSKTNTP